MRSSYPTHNRRNHIISFKAISREQLDAQQFNHLLDASYLRGHIFGHGFALCFVLRLDRVSIGIAGVHRQGEKHRFAGLEQFQEHCSKAKGGIGGFARWAAEARKSEVSTVNLCVAINDVKVMHRIRLYNIDVALCH